jgi:hypothetical protein
LKTTLFFYRKTAREAPAVQALLNQKKNDTTESQRGEATTNSKRVDK